MYHPSLIHPQTHERTIERTQTSACSLTPGEKLAVELQALDMVLRSNPPESIRVKSEARLDEITRQLEETTEAELHRLAGAVFGLISVQYPPELFFARRAEFIRQVEAKVS